MSFGNYCLRAIKRTSDKQVAHGTEGGQAMRLSDGQSKHILERVTQTPWADIAGAVETVETGLGLVIDATRDDFKRWEDGASAEGYDDEFSIDAATVQAMPPEWKLAYVARLARSVALSFGVDTEFSASAEDPVHGRDEIAPLLHHLYGIVSEDPDSLAATVDRLSETLSRLSDAPAERRGWYLTRVERDAEEVGSAAANLRDRLHSRARRRPVEDRAIGLVMRHSERDGVMEPPAELRELVAAVQSPAEEIDRALGLLVTREGRTVGGTAFLADLDGHRLGQLLVAALIEWGPSGEWALTDKGRAMSCLLTAYADRKYEWRSLVSDPIPGFSRPWIEHFIDLDS
jgi:hypothetical protein